MFFLMDLLEICFATALEIQQYTFKVSLKFIEPFVRKMKKRKGCTKM